MDAIETMAAGHLAAYIYNCSVASSYTSNNSYGVSTTKSNLHNAVSASGEANSVSFYIGHGGTQEWNSPNFPWPLEKHWVIQMNNGELACDIDDAYAYSGGRKNRFVFLWSCHQGEVIGGHHGSSGYAYGMPYCWQRDTTMSTDGYASPDGKCYCFIGFNGTGPALTYDGFGFDAGYWFAGYFYRRAMQSGYSVNSTLDYAARQTWGVGFSFANCVYRTGFMIGNDAGKMGVYGDGGLMIGSAGYELPPVPPPPIPGGCPTLSVWNGANYVNYGVIDIHDPSGNDVVRDVSVISEDVGLDRHRATFRLTEGWEGLSFSESVVDCVRLYAFDSHGRSHKCPLVSAEHSTLGNVLPILLRSDDRRAQMTLFETVDLTFVVPCKNVRSFTFEIEGCNEEKGIT